jgi:uncharacterized protein YjbJ (UPF0337 family)
MKPSTKDQAAGKRNAVKGQLKERARRIAANPNLEYEGTAEKIGGKIRQWVGKIEMAVVA